jgi:hypothetical protein
VIGAGPFGEHAEVHRPQGLLHREAHGLRQQPAQHEDRQGEGEARQEQRDLVQELSCGIDQDVDVLLRSRFEIRGGARRFHQVALHSRIPCSGMPAQVGRFVNS